MNKTTIMISNNPVNVDALYYISNNNYYIIYTDLKTDENDFVVLHIAKILQEVVNTSNGPQPTGYLIGTTITSDEEYDIVKKDIAGIIDAKQNNIDSPVHLLDASTLNGLKIRDTKIFRLKRMVYDQVFNSNNNTPNPVINRSNSTIEDKYKEQLELNKQLQSKVDELTNKLNSIKNMLG